MGRVLLAAIVGAVILFAWGAVSWMFIGWHDTSGGMLSNESAVVAAIEEGNAETGVYWIPGLADEMDADASEAWMERHRRGPVGVLVYRADGYEPLAPGVFVKGFVINIFSALVAAWLLSVAAGSIAGYVGRVAFVAGLGLLIGIYSDLTVWNFMNFPTDWTVVNVVDRIVTWLLAGLAIAAIVKGRTPAD